MEIEKHTPFKVQLKKRNKTNLIVVHCSATQPLKKYDWQSIDRMHRQRGFLLIGYHYVITVDGKVQEGRPVDTIGAHASGYNDKSIGICLIGGVDKEGKSTNNFTKKQFEALDELISYLRQTYKNCKVLGHRDLPNVKKDCPCFDVKARYSTTKNS